MANQIVAGEQYYELDGQLWEIKRQLRQSSGYPFDAEMLKLHLQAAIEGCWAGENFFRETGDMGQRIIRIPALARPTLEGLQSKFDWIKRIEVDTSPVEPVVLVLGTVLRVGENAINGVEYQRRRAPKIDVCLGYQQAIWLVEHQNEFPKLMALLGKIYIDFPGLVVVRGDDGRYFPYLNGGGGRWRLDWDRVDNDLNSNGRIAASRKSQ